MDRLKRADPDAVRRIIAGEWLRADAISSALGSVRLRPHQLDAARRIRGMIEKHGGALLCDEVGLGKTYAALAIAGSYSRPLVIAPASLRAMWLEAAGRASVTIRFVSLESLSRSVPAQRDHDFVIVDEAHHFRTTSTARYHALAKLAARSPVLLISATPVHNKAEDLTALIQLFLGSAARALSQEQAAGLVVRRGQGEAVGPFPRVHEPMRLDLPHDPRLLEALLALPPPIPPKDGGMAAAIVTQTVVRLWASSDAALREGLRRRLAKTVAIRASLEVGRYPTRRQLTAWSYGDGSVQLGFAELLAPEESPVGDEVLDSVRAHERALMALLESLPGAPGADTARVAHLRAVRSRHPDAKVVAFSQFAETVAMYYRGLARDGRVAMLTSRGARVAGGAMTRREALERFAPMATGVSSPGSAEDISLLIATDLLSEGVNLQDACVVVHLDLPWTATVLEQRVGRVARLGARNPEVFVYAIDPPAPSQDLFRAETIIRRKAALAESSIGASRIPPLFARATPGSRSEVETGEAIRRTLATWARVGRLPDDGRPVWAAASADRDAVLALVVARGKLRLVAGNGAQLSADCHAVRDLLDIAAGNPAHVRGHHVAAAHDLVRRWLGRELASDDAGKPSLGRNVLARRITAVLARLLSECPLHERSGLAARIACLHERIQSPFPLGVEWEIEAALDSAQPGAVLDALEVIVGDERRELRDEESGVRALLILCCKDIPGSTHRNRQPHPSLTAATNA